MSFNFIILHVYTNLDWRIDLHTEKYSENKSVIYNYIEY